ncbi:MAG: hypothetical protein L0Y71_14260 [Gemmataceae bacterium]|nr:hypothetical protein [Gemmataceae bacterium]
MAAIQDKDIWYVRLPDGRVIRSRSTVSLRYHVRKGRIPLTSRVRRTEKEDWRSLPDVQELAESAAVARARSNRGNGMPDGRMRSRAAVQEWRLLGVRGLVRELLDALDSSLHRAKLGTACLLGMLGGVGVITWKLLATTFGESQFEWTVAASIWAIVMLLAICLGITFITKYTALELSKMRQPRRSELWSGIIGQTLRLAAALLIVLGAAAVLIWLLRWIPGWMREQHAGGSAWWGHAASATEIVRLILEVIFWPVIALAPLLLGPILIVEQGSFLQGIRDWWRLLGKHLGRIFLYEALATTLAAVFTVPLLIPIAIASWPLGAMPGQHQVIDATVMVLGGIALTPLIGYLVVANVFIYLNLRYEFFHSAR